MVQWRRTLYVSWVTQFFAVMGFSFVMPFIPYYIQELGITDLKQVGWWAGLVTSAQALSMALMAPMWGALSDRYGRKLMVQRAMFSGAVVLSLMALVTSVQQLLVLRFVQGMLTGTVSASTALVASITPKEHAGKTLGSLQTASFLGVSFGPLLGGILGDSLGYRPSFLVTGGLLLLSGILVTFLIHEDFHPSEDVLRGSARGYGATARVLAAGGLLAIFAVRIVMRIGSRVLGPVLPLFVQTIVPVGAPVASATGLIAAGSALGSAVGSPLIGRWGDRYGHRRMLVLSAIAAGICFIPQAAVNSPWTLVFWQILSGFAVGGTISTITALLAASAPEGHHGAVFGADASVVAAANAVGPLAGAAIAAGFGLRTPFLLAAGLLLLGAFMASLWVRGGRGVGMG